MGTMADRNAQLNEAIGQGAVLEVFREIYHPEVEMIEADGQSWKGLDENFKREQQFFGSITELRGGGVTQSAVNEEEGISFATMWFDASLQGGQEMKMTEVAVREWKDGRIIKERFFYNPQSSD